MKYKSILKLVTPLCVAALLSACGGGGGGSDSTPTPSYTIGGTVSGLAGSGLTLQNNAGDDVIISADGSFTFSTALTDGSNYEVTVLAQPTSLSQSCTVTSGSGALAGADVIGVAVNCVINTYTVGGTVTGLAEGNSVVLQNNGGDDLTVNADGSFAFNSALADGSSYEVAVLTQPISPNQTCVVTGGSESITGSNVTSVTVNCATNTYTVGGIVSGLAGSGLTLQNNAGDDVIISADGSFTFSTALTDGSNYEVTVLAQPTSLSQSCTVTSGSGALAGADVIGVAVNCVINTYTVGGTVTGLAEGNSVVLQNNGGDDLTVNADGSFAFNSALADGSSYEVAVLTQPISPNQTCVVTGGSESITGSNVTSVTVNCATNTYTVGGIVSGLVGSGLLLQNNAGDNLMVNTDGSFTFTTALSDGGSYEVSVLTQPSTPNQFCSVTNSSGILTGSDVADVSVNCIAAYTISGTVTGLAGSGLTLQNNAGDDVGISADGSFTFSTALTEGSSYEVSVFTQPTNPSQICSVGQGSGVVSGTDVANVAISCVSTYTLGGTVSGLAGTGLVLQNNAGDNLSVSASGGFTFATAITDGSQYEVSVLTQPTNPAQICSVTSGGSGTLAGTDVADVLVTCVNSYTIGGTLSGLQSGAVVTMQNNDGDAKVMTTNGPFTFATALVDGSSYAVSVLIQPDGYHCTVNNGSGTLGGSDISNVEVNCGIYKDSGQALGADDTYSVALGDVDGDGDLDLVAGNSGQANRVYLNNGQGSFIDSGQALGADKTSSVALGDVDSDGDLDMVAGTNLYRANLVYTNDGAGSFSNSGQALGSDATLSVALGDVDGDGDLDIVAGNQAGAANRVYLNNGVGIFTDSGQMLGTNDTHSVALGDVDGDGDLDLVEGNGGGVQPNRIYRNNGTGSFTDSGQALGADDTYSVVLGDVDGDGDLDIVAGNERLDFNPAQPNRVYFNDGVGNYTDSGQVLGGSSTYELALGDVDGDGDLDLVVGNDTNADLVYLNDGAGNYVDSGQLLGGNGSTFSVTLGDVDGDKDLDLVTGGFFTKVNYIYLNMSK